MGPSPCGPPPTGGAIAVRCDVDRVAIKGRDLGNPIPDCRSWLSEHGINLSDGEGTWSCDRGLEIPTKYSRPNFNAQFGFWNQSSWEELDYFLCLSCPRWEAENRCGLINSSPALSQCVGVYPQQFRVPTLLGVPRKGAGECPYLSLLLPIN